MTRRMRLWVLLVTGLSCGAGSCAQVTLYDIVRTPIEDCVINPAGEFCGDTGSPITQKLALEVRGAETYVYLGDETWVAEGTEGVREVRKETVVTRDPGPCETTSRQELRFEVLNEGSPNAEFSGSLEVSTRVEGAESCGDTPRGTRILFQLSGFSTNSF